MGGGEEEQDFAMGRLESGTKIYYTEDNVECRLLVCKIYVNLGI